MATELEFVANLLTNKLEVPDFGLKVLNGFSAPLLDYRSVVSTTDSDMTSAC